MAKTINQFLCGCPLGFGVGIIIFVNLIYNLFTIATVSLNIIFNIPSFGASDPPGVQIFSAAWCLFGMPFVLAAIIGMWAKQESNLRLYLFYLSATFALDIVFVFQWLLTSDLCGSMPRSIQRHGSAFACGFIRITSVGFTVMTLVLCGYAVHCIWSYCEDLKAGGGGKGLDQLMQFQEGEKAVTAYATFAAGITRTGNNLGETFAANNNPYKHQGGSSRITLPMTPYDGTFHETAFPPMPKSFKSAV